MGWIEVGKVSDFNKNTGGCVKVNGQQIALFNFNLTDWYAVQNRCPHQEQMVMSRGLIGDANGKPKVACPLHKNNFDLETGEHLGGDASMKLTTFPVKVEDEAVFIQSENVE